MAKVVRSILNMTSTLIPLFKIVVLFGGFPFYNGTVTHNPIVIVTAKKSIPSTKQGHNCFSSPSNPQAPQWNPSINIDEEGFLKLNFRRIVGDWEVEANIGGRYG